MVKLEITTVIGCVNMCDYCPQNKIIAAYKNKDKMMSLETFKRCIDKVPTTVPILFSGFAEPFQNPNCIKMIEYAVKKGFLVKVFTTGIGLKKEYIPILEKIPIKTIGKENTSVEIHLPDDSNNTKIKVDKNYLEVIKALKNSKIPNLTFLLYGRMHPEVKKVLNMEVEDLSRMIQNRGSNLDNLPPLLKIQGKVMCGNSGRLLNDNVLLPSGDVVLCCQDYGLKHRLGNLLEMSYEDLFKTESFKNMQKALDSEDGEILCRYCSSAVKQSSSHSTLKKRLQKAGLLKPLYTLTKVPLIKRLYVASMNFKNRRNLIYRKK